MRKARSKLSAASRAKQAVGMRRFFAAMTPRDRAEYQAKRCGSKAAAEKISLTMIAHRMARPWDEIKTPAVRRLRVIAEQGGKCIGCGLGEWRGLPITFELDHKDGRNGNNSRENVTALCPNCHSQTPTWRGRGGEARHKGITDAMIEAAIAETGNSRAALVKLGLNTGGSNHRRVKQVLMRASSSTG